MSKSNQFLSAPNCT